jgi:uncharacterized membrane protein YhaH (DUF805 family)
MDFSYYLDPIRNHYFDFQGVTGRQPFWMFILINLLISIALGVVVTLIHLRPLLYLYDLAVLLPTLGLSVRRMHDVGKSGWWVLIGIIPVIGWIIVIYLYAQPSSTPYPAAVIDPQRT